MARNIPPKHRAELDRLKEAGATEDQLADAWSAINRGDSDDPSAKLRWLHFQRHLIHVEINALIRRTEREYELPGRGLRPKDPWIVLDGPGADPRFRGLR